MKNYLIEDKITGRLVANGLAENKMDARRKSGATGRRYMVIEATVKGASYHPIKRS